MTVFVIIVTLFLHTCILIFILSCDLFASEIANSVLKIKKEIPDFDRKLVNHLYMKSINDLIVTI